MTSRPAIAGRAGIPARPTTPDATVIAEEYDRGGGRNRPRGTWRLRGDRHDAPVSIATVPRDDGDRADRRRAVFGGGSKGGLAGPPPGAHLDKR